MRPKIHGNFCCKTEVARKHSGNLVVLSEGWQLRWVLKMGKQRRGEERKLGMSVKAPKQCAERPRGVESTRCLGRMAGGRPCISMAGYTKEMGRDKARQAEIRF